MCLIGALSFRTAIHTWLCVFVIFSFQKTKPKHTKNVVIEMLLLLLREKKKILLIWWKTFFFTGSCICTVMTQISSGTDKAEAFHAAKSVIPVSYLTTDFQTKNQMTYLKLLSWIGA